VVEIGALLPVDLDVDEELVHGRRDGLVLERLVLHHVAPVARRVADGEEDGFVLRLRLVQGLGAPGVPVDGVVRVLEQVGGRRRRQVVLVGDHARAVASYPEES
jgi:hypothetical protein